MIFSSGHLVQSFDWPVVDRRVMATFGESRQGSFAAVIRICCGENQVFPIADGEIIFQHREQVDYHSLPRANGSFIALQHEGGIQSVYAHLKTDSMLSSKRVLKARRRQIRSDVFLNEIIAPLTNDAERELLQAVFVRDGDVFTLREDISKRGKEAIWGIFARIEYIDSLGLVGDSGLSEGVHLALMIIDVEQNKILNPIKREKPPLLPPLTAPDGTTNKGPTIESVFIQRGNALQKLSDDLAVAPGEVEVLAEIFDKSVFLPFHRNMAPYRFYLADSGRVVRSITVDALEELDNHLVISETKITHNQFYQQKWLYRLGRLTLVEGNTQIQIGTENYFGHESYLDIKLKVVTD